MQIIDEKSCGVDPRSSRQNVQQPDIYKFSLDIVQCLIVILSLALIPLRFALILWL